jgi:hypothetical protein
VASWIAASASSRRPSSPSRTDAGCERIWADVASGRLARRPGWDACLDHLRAGDELVVTRLSRMARSVRHLTGIAALLAERGIDLVVLKQGIDTATVAGRFTFHVLAAMDEMLADLICEGTKEGLASARARGRSAAASPGSLPGRPRWPGACTPRPAATGSAAIPSTRSPAPSQSPARPSTGTLTRTTPSGNRTRARGRGPSPARGHWRHLPCDHASGGRHGSGAGPRAAPAFRPHPCRAGLPCLRTQPASRPEALRQREDLAIVWLHQDSSSGPISQHRHCASCQPHVECGTVECAHCGDGPVLTGALVDQLRKHDPNQPTALRDWLTGHGWQLEPEPLCPADSNSIKD